MDALFSLGKLLVISPHLDDAVFSCAELLARHPGAVVATVFTCIPPGFGRLTEWDALCGFHDAAQAVALRREEDRAALELLFARPVWLDFCDSQYEATPPQAVLSDALQDTLQREHPDTVLIPAGLFHSDHVLVHQAMLGLRRQHPGKNWLMYEEALYRRLPGLLQQRLVALFEAGVEATPIVLAGGGTEYIKWQAVQCYASQLRALTARTKGYADVRAPERYWRLDALRAHSRTEARR